MEVIKCEILYFLCMIKLVNSMVNTNEIYITNIVPQCPELKLQMLEIMEMSLELLHLKRQGPKTIPIETFSVFT